jgi:cytoskeletal protein RodZ
LRDVGEGLGDLRRARERAGLEIEEISARTKIKPAFLRALETGHFEVLPGPFFTRTFLRTYAREVGVPPDEVVREYDRLHGQRLATVAPDGIALTAVLEEPHTETALPLRVPRAAWQVAGAAALLVVVFAVVNRTGDTDEAAAPPPPPAVGTTGVAAATRSEVPSPAVQSAAPDSLTIQIHPTATVWVAATADGASAVYKLLQPGQNVTVKGRDTYFRIGNAGAFAFSINGVEAKPVGAAGEVREFRITTENFRSYIQ